MRKRGWLSTIMSSPQKGWCFLWINPKFRGTFPSPMWFELFSLHLCCGVEHLGAEHLGVPPSQPFWRTGPPVATVHMVWSPIRLIRYLSQAPISFSWKTKGQQKHYRRPTVGLFRPALSSSASEKHTKTRAKLRELCGWNAGKCFFSQWLTHRCYIPTQTNKQMRFQKKQNKMCFLLFPPKYW